MMGFLGITHQKVYILANGVGLFEWLHHARFQVHGFITSTLEHERVSIFQFHLPGLHHNLIFSAFFLSDLIYC